MNDLRSAGAEAVGSDINRSGVLDVAGKVLILDGIEIYAFEFPGIDDTQDAVNSVAPDGYAVGNAFVEWTSSPHFYAEETPVVLYVGDVQSVIGVLQEVLGAQFAGSGSIVPGRKIVSDKAIQTAHR